MPLTSAYQRRIRRAEQLASQHSFAREILGFYIHVARFQQILQIRLDRMPVDKAPPATLPKSGELISNFQGFLSIVEKNGPERVANAARELLASSSERLHDLLSAIWQDANQPPDTAEEFLAYAFLQPYAEFARSHAGLQLENYIHPLCPFCNRRPALGVLRPMGDGAQRRLICGFCLAEWDFRRIVCPGCGEEDYGKLPIYTAEAFPHIRVECCDRCQIYIKSIDLTKNGLAEPLVDELSSLPLDLWAQEHGYSKLYPNLLGM
ncbi:MAG: formate dehydrogenase accessory protein FdhE [Candidatus Sulfotelmatobacter sp.]